VAARVRGDASEVSLEIDDAGPGVAAERRADAFSAFVPSAHGGLGLGLALVQRIAAAHGGRAWVEDRRGGGARVGFSVSREALESRAASAS
jgi:signal transduction histidine kinase